MTTLIFYLNIWLIGIPICLCIMSGLVMWVTDEKPGKVYMEYSTGVLVVSFFWPLFMPVMLGAIIGNVLR